MPVSQIDNFNGAKSRLHIEEALRSVSRMAYSNPDLTVLEIGPPDGRRGGSSPRWHNLDITPGCTYQYDITKKTPLPEGMYDIVLCLDVLEHCLQPFDAIKEIRRILKPGGMLCASTPLNFRIHGPIPDCWRFTEHGIKVLMRDWDNLTIDIRESDRFLFPSHYWWKAYCNKDKSISDEELSKQFRFIYE